VLRVTVAVECARARDQDVKHDGGTLLRRHVLNARRWPNRWGISFGKDRKGSVGRGFAIGNDIPEADFQDWVAAND
jgi:hypothetical protein